MLKLTEITENNWMEAASLSVKDGQKGFVASSAGIIARGYVYRDCNAKVFAFEDEGTIVGVALVREFTDEPLGYDLQQFMIDQRYQGRGYGSEALRLILDELRREGHYDHVEVCVKKDDEEAIRLYEKHGFVDSGYFDEEAPDSVNMICYFKNPDTGLTARVILAPLTEDDREQFIRDNQDAFNYGALVEFGIRDEHYEEDGEIISHDTIDQSINGGEAYRIIQNGRKVGGVVIKVDGERGNLDLLFVSPEAHSKGIGYAAWCEIEHMHPEVKVWETATPYFEKRNIHFYVNRCGFHIVEFFNSHHPDPHDPDPAGESEEAFSDGMFRFEKIMK